MVRSIHVADVPHHVNPVPHAAEHGGFVVSSAIMGMDAATRKFPDTKEAQLALAFENLRRVIKACGVTPQDVIRLTLYFADKDDRPLVNPHWLEMWPDENARPARHALLASELPPGCVLQLEFMAVAANG